MNTIFAKYLISNFKLIYLKVLYYLKLLNSKF